MASEPTTAPTLPVVEGPTDRDSAEDDLGFRLSECPACKNDGGPCWQCKRDEMTTITIAELESLRSTVSTLQQDLANSEQERKVARASAEYHMGQSADWRDRATIARDAADIHAAAVSTLTEERDAAREIIEEAMDGSVWGWTNEQVVNFRQRCKAFLATPPSPRSESPSHPALLPKESL